MVDRTAAAARRRAAGPVRLNLVDTPGHADFVGELRAGLRAADAALFVISAAETPPPPVGVIDGATRMLWQECADVGMPRAVVVTHIDQPRGDFAAAVENCQLVFGDGVHPLYLPIDPAAGDAPDRADRPALPDRLRHRHRHPGGPARPTTTRPTRSPAGGTR